MEQAVIDQDHDTIDLYMGHFEDIGHLTSKVEVHKIGKTSSGARVKQPISGVMSSPMLREAGDARRSLALTLNPRLS